MKNYTIGLLGPSQEFITTIKVSAPDSETALTKAKTLLIPNSFQTLVIISVSQE